jgi:hypothetical protein
VVRVSIKMAAAEQAGQRPFTCSCLIAEYGAEKNRSSHGDL